jgi:hypothetical protein
VEAVAAADRVLHGAAPEPGGRCATGLAWDQYYQFGNIHRKKIDKKIGNLDEKTVTDAEKMKIVCRKWPMTVNIALTHVIDALTHVVDAWKMTVFSYIMSS